MTDEVLAPLADVADVVCEPRDLLCRVSGAEPLTCCVSRDSVRSGRWSGAAAVCGAVTGARVILCRRRLSGLGGRRTLGGANAAATSGAYLLGSGWELACGSGGRGESEGECGVARASVSSRRRCSKLKDGRGVTPRSRVASWTYSGGGSADSIASSSVVSTA